MENRSRAHIGIADVIIATAWLFKPTPVGEFLFMQPVMVAAAVLAFGAAILAVLSDLLEKTEKFRAMLLGIKEFAERLKKRPHNAWSALAGAKLKKGKRSKRKGKK